MPHLQETKPGPEPEAFAASAGGFRVFVLLWLGQVISTLGSSMTTFAVGVWVYQSTGSATRYALIIFFHVLPGLVAAPLAGALVDRWERRRVLIASDVMAGLSTMILLLLVWQGRLEHWQIYVLVAINSVFSSFQMPAFTASVSLLVPPRHLGRAAGMGQVGEAASRIVSPLLAGVLLVKISLMGILFVDLVTLLLALLTLVVIRIPRPPAAAEDEAQGEARKSLADEAHRGFAYLRDRPGLLSLLLMFTSVNFALGVMQSLLAPLVLTIASADALGLVLSVAAAGLLAGGLLMSVWGGPKRRVRAIFGCVGIQALVLLVAGLKPSVTLLAGSAFIFMLSMGVLTGCSTAFWQSKVAPGIQGRVFAIRRMIAMSSLPLAYLLGGPLAERVFEPLAAAGLLPGASFDGAEPGIRLLFMTLGLLLLLILAVGYSYPRLRRVEEELPDALGAAESAAETAS